MTILALTFDQPEVQSNVVRVLLFNPEQLSLAVPGQQRIIRPLQDRHPPKFREGEEEGDRKKRKEKKRDVNPGC